MAFEPSLWRRLEFDGTPIYVRPDKPDWFVPNRSGDFVLESLLAGAPLDDHLHARRFLMRLPDDLPSEYRGRAEALATERLSELWLHVTNRCNSTCTHCLFASGPEDAPELSAERMIDLAHQASALGCRVFALTGGEPLVHADFEAVIDALLVCEGARVVILTNGTLLRRYADAFRRWPRDRVHLQISVDGLGAHHDAVRGHGAFDRLLNELTWLKTAGTPFALSMCVMETNASDMPGVVDLAAEVGAANVHFMWYFVRGRGGRTVWPSTDAVFAQLCQATLRAKAIGIGLDNIDSLRSQVFAPAGTIHDGSSGAWDSIAVGPDGRLYPSPALVGIGELATTVGADLASAWRGSPVLERIRRTTAAQTDSPLRFLLGGGDPDHCFLHAGRFTGCDPYQMLHERTALWLIAREASHQSNDGPPRLRLKMGDVLESCGPHGPVATVHSNCLLSVAHVDGHTAVGEFYREAAANPRQDIRNPVCYPQDLIEHIPDEARVRSYGCGSPVIDADPQPGEVVVDLGSGTGVECFIASRLVGPKGRVIGVDMLDTMLDGARKSAEAVAARLGYGNVEFCKGYLEALPLEDGSADLVLSNCVLNLSTNKRRVFAEILRVLRPGARLMVSDVVCEREPDATIRNDDSLRGQCIAGALTERDLFGLLDEAGFVSAYVVKRFPYRTVRGHPFFSMTFEAFKPTDAVGPKTVMYRGPATALVTATGQLLPAGQTCRLADGDLSAARGDLFEFDADGQVANTDLGASSCCAVPTETLAEPAAESSRPAAIVARRMSGCMVCGSPLVYLDVERPMACSFCGQTLPSNARCQAGHFVCDACHTQDGAALIEHVCLTTAETDMIALMERIRGHQGMAVHGPDHHALVPGVILATYRNRGGQVTDEMIRTAVRRGARVAGGACGLWGVCGAAVGVGIGFGVILRSNPLKSAERQIVQTAVQRTLEQITSYQAARCCQRDCWLALRAAAELSVEYLPITLGAEAPLVCRQTQRNRECIADRCPLWPVLAAGF